MATVNFLYRSKLDSANLTARLLFRHEGKDYTFDALIRKKVTLEFWKKRNKKIRDVNFNNLQNEINNELSEVRTHVLKEFDSVFYSNQELLTSIINKQWLINVVSSYYSVGSNLNDKLVPNRVVDFFDYLRETRKDELAPRSLIKYTTYKKIVERFEIETDKIILLKDLGNNLKFELVDYMKKEKYSVSSIKSTIKYLRVIWGLANKLGIETNKLFDPLKMEKDPEFKIYLTLDDLAKIEQMGNTDLIDARDWLIISCYTGQRISDFMRFESSMIRVENDVKYIEFSQQKTSKKMTLPLHPKVIEILDRRKGEFPKKIPENRYNEEIKTICRIAGLEDLIMGKKFMPFGESQRRYEGEYPKWELVSSHIGRRSFATNFYGKIPTTYLIYATGHGTEAQFLNYIGKSNKDLAKELFNYFK
ncbi:phage integrase SAM-like domain-containing protein [Flavobacterium agricola]|uniref:Phage integrase SAM-like domain-containing protein n=1 Tax=Flavobacterium agricola TaxID=2870839 RepID=A0ABY6M0J8_9FLAO|nr:phage integrase SAM-like domain-containing protein [Flavobacterium agricola]UYW02075.1 phage integrase SAM-like domain-containing protein [Flavobacterium agricola]